MGFRGGRKTAAAGVKASEQGYTQQQTQPTYMTPGRNRTQATMVRGVHSHHCALLVLQYYQSIFLFRKLLTTALLCFLLFAAGNETAAKNADDNLDFNLLRVATEVLDVISKPFFDKDSVILLNAGLHYLESTNFSNYQKTISSLIRLFQETKMVTRADGNLLFPGEMIWRTTTALNKEKLDGKHIQARRFLTYQV